MTKKKKNNNEIVISFVGGSKNDVTGSCVLISYPKKDNERGLIAIECGLVQGEPTLEVEYSINKKMIERVPVKNIEGVFVGHCHIDHIGNLPIFNDDNGFNGSIIGSNITLEIGKKLIIDSVKIHKENVDRMRNKGKKTKYLYTQQQAYNMFDKMISKEIGPKHKFNEYIEYQFFNNSHVPGACMIKFWIRKPNNTVKTIVYTSDIGSKHNLKLQNFVKPTEFPTKANLWITEGTYGESSRSFSYKDAIEERENMKETIKKYLLNEKRIFIPSFSFARTQNLMCMLYEWFKDEDWFKFNVVLDGKLLHEINTEYTKVLEEDEIKYFSEVMKWNKFKYNKEWKSTEATLSVKTPGIYIATSGFLTAGRSVEYLKNFLNSTGDCIMFVGYAGGEGSVGARVLDPSVKFIEVTDYVPTADGETNKKDKHKLLKRCDVIRYKTFSSHIQQDELIEMWKQINVSKIIIHHASKEARHELHVKGKEKLLEEGITTQICPVSDCADQFVL